MRMTSHDIIRKPVITEKSMAAMAENKYTFIVHMSANKVQIKRAVEEVFGVKLEKFKQLELWEKLREWAYMLERELTKRKLS